MGGLREADRGQLADGLKRGCPCSKDSVGRWRRDGSGRGRRNGPVFGAEVSCDLGNLLIGERVGKGRHFLTAVEDLVSDFVGGPELVFVDLGKIRTLLASNTVHGVAVGTILIAKEGSAGELVGFGLRCCASRHGDCGNRGQKQYEHTIKTFEAKDHRSYFLMAGAYALWRSAFGGFPCADHCDCLFDTAGAGFGLLCALNPVDEFLPMRVRECGEGFCLHGGFGKGGLEVCGNGDGAGRVVDGELHFDGIASGCAGPSEDVFADSEDVNAGAGDERVAVGETVDGGANRDLALAAEDFRDAEGDLEVGPGTARAAAGELGLELEWGGLGFGHSGNLQRLSWAREGLKGEVSFGFCLGCEVVCKRDSRLRSVE